MPVALHRPPPHEWDTGSSTPVGAPSAKSSKFQNTGCDAMCACTNQSRASRCGRSPRAYALVRYVRVERYVFFIHLPRCGLRLSVDASARSSPAPSRFIREPAPALRVFLARAQARDGCRIAGFTIMASEGARAAGNHCIRAGARVHAVRHCPGNRHSRVADFTGTRAHKCATCASAD